MKSIINILKKVPSCKHEFHLDDIVQTGIPAPETPAYLAGVEVWTEYFKSIYTHPSHTHRIKCTCQKCGKVFHAHCGLDLLDHGKLVQRRSA